MVLTITLTSFHMLRARRVDVAGWLFRAGVTVLFIVVGLQKFDGVPTSSWVKIFAAIGFGQWFRVATGVVEVVGGALYLFPATCKVAAVLLASAMVGAIVAHLTVLHDPISIVIPLTLLVAIVLIALRDPTLDLIASRQRR